MAESSGKRNALRSAPTVAVNDDAGRAFLAIRQLSVAVGVKHFENFSVGFATLAILKYPHLHAGRILVPEMSGELDFLMNRVVASDKPAHKSNHNDAR